MSSLIRPALLTLLVLCSPMAMAGGFSAMVSPPRFEGTAKPGTTYRNVVEIGNVSTRPAHFTLRTADWQIDPRASAVFQDALAPGSCRPWVGIEAPEITIAPNGKRRYRFEVAVPAGAPDGECRFALMINGDAEPSPDGSTVPVAGRIGVIVYLAIGEATPALTVTGSDARVLEGRIVPVLRVRNSGNAHGRLEGLVDGRDASGHTYAFAPASLPILAGETRDIPLTPQGDNDSTPAPAVVWPLVLKGRLDWGSNHLGIDTTVTR